MNKVSLGLVGFGYWGPNLARAISNSANAELNCIVESNSTLHPKINREYPEATICKSIQDVWKINNVQGLVIATPPNTHFEIAIESLQHGKNVLVEKPLAMSALEAIKIKEISIKENLIAMPGHTFLFNAAIIWAKEYIRAGQLGEILYLYSQRLNLGQIRKDVDVIWNLAPHDVSIFDYLIGQRAIGVSATASSSLQSGLSDVAFLSIDYPDKIKAHAHVSWLDPSKTRKVTIVGTKKMIVIDDTSMDTPIRVYDKSVKLVIDQESSFAGFKYQVHTGDVVIPTLYQKEPLINEVEAFAHAIQMKVSPVASIDDAISVATILEASIKSISENGSRIGMNIEN
jgi:predicted dehydrogenase